MIVNRDGGISCYSSSSKVIFGIRKFYLEDAEISKLSQIYGEEYHSIFTDLPNNPFFTRNKNISIGPVRLKTTKDELEVQTIVKLVRTFESSNVDFEFEPLYLIETTIPDLFSYEYKKINHSNSFSSDRKLDFGDEVLAVYNYDLTEKNLVIITKEQKAMTSFRNKNFYEKMDFRLSKFEIMKKKIDYGNDIRTLYLNEHGKSVT